MIYTPNSLPLSGPPMLINNLLIFSGYDFIVHKKPENDVDPHYFDNDLNPLPYIKP